MTARAGETPALKEESLTILFNREAFLNVNPNDVKAGYHVLAETVGRRRGYLVSSKVEMFDDAAQFDRLVGEEAAVRMVVLSGWRYLGMDTSAITPMFIGSVGGRVGKQYLLLTRKDRGLNTLDDLRGKEIAIYETANASQGRVWLETLLLENRCGGLEEFLTRVDAVGKPTMAVLPVFFGNKAACVVDRAGFELMRELNPQVAQQLQTLAASEVLVDGLICLRNSGWPAGTFREELIQTLAELHLEPAGAQILTLFKAERLVPFREEHLAATRKLHQTHDRLQKEGKPGT